MILLPQLPHVMIVKVAISLYNDNYVAYRWASDDNVKWVWFKVPTKANQTKMRSIQAYSQPRQRIVQVGPRRREMIVVDTNENEYAMEERKPGQDSHRMMPKCEQIKEEMIVGRGEL